MKTTYLVKKDPNKDGKDNWTIMNGYDFARFIETAEGQARKKNFGRLDACGLDDETIIVECGADTEKKWRVDRDKHYYLKKCETESNYSTFSYSAIYSEEGEISGEDMLPDEECNVEESVIRKNQLEELRKAINKLSSLQQSIIASVFLSAPAMTEAELANALGISQQRVSYQKKIALQKLKKMLCD